MGGLSGGIEWKGRFDEKIRLWEEGSEMERGRLVGEGVMK